jgi:hypothetical protein
MTRSTTTSLAVPTMLTCGYGKLGISPPNMPCIEVKVCHTHPLSCSHYQTRKLVKGREACVLMKLPAGYKLYTHKKGSQHDPRSDHYLYGERRHCRNSEVSYTVSLQDHDMSDPSGRRLSFSCTSTGSSRVCRWTTTTSPIAHAHGAAVFLKGRSAVFVTDLTQ